jgi:hypothetical protein
MVPCYQGRQALTCQRLQQLNSLIINMATHFNDSEIQKLACKAIHMIAQKDPQAGDYLGREGACEAVIAATMKHGTVVLVARWGWCAVSALTLCKAADILAVGDDNITRLYEAGVCNRMVFAYKRYGHFYDIAPPIVQTAVRLVSMASSRDALIQAGLCEAILSYGASSRQYNVNFVQAVCTLAKVLAATSSTAKQMLIDAGILQDLVDMLQWWKRWPTLIRDICNTVYEFINGNSGNAQKLINTGIDRKLAYILNRHINDPEVAVAGCQLVQCLPSSCWRSDVPCVTIVNILKRHIGNTVVLIAALQAANSFASFGADLREVMIRAGAVQTIGKAIEYHMFSADVLKYGCLLVFKLSDAGACKAVATIMQIHSNNTVVLIAACEAVIKLTEYNTTTAVKLVQADVHNSVVSAITQHMRNKKLVECGCAVLASLATNSTAEIKTTMAKHDICEALTNAMRRHINNSAIVRDACIVVQHLALELDNRVKLRDADACAVVVAAVT